ncbi:MAG: hypothetical protein SYC29_05990 [Planctomycetota bacterium]|nr:hypothetical protein [Planctomycetota bacterium]
MRFACLAFAAAFALAGGATADQLALDWLPPDLKWVAHLDAEAFFASELGKTLAENEQLDFADIKFSELERHLNMDAETELMGITVYGPVDGGEVAIISLAETVDLQAIVDAAKDEHAEGHKKVVVDDIPLHVWDDDVVTFLAARGSRRYVIAGEEPMLIARAAAIALDKADSYADADEKTMELEPPGGAMMFGAVASGRMLPDMDVVSEVIRHADAFTLAIAEREEQIEAAMSMSADSRQRARDIVDVIDGIFALVRLNAEENEWLAQIAKFTGDAKVERTGRQITITLRTDTETLLKLLGKIDAH